MDPIDTTLAKIARLNSAELAQLWPRMAQSPRPELSIDLMRHHLANIVQERAEGGLSVRARRQLRRLQAEVDEIGLSRGTGHEELDEGTRLIREWRGQTYEAVVTSGGLIFDGRRFSSLTAIAHEITGTRHWPGPKFFGLRKRGAANRRDAGTSNA